MRPTPTKAELVRRRSATARAALTEACSQSTDLSNSKPAPENFGLSSDFSIADCDRFLDIRIRQALTIKTLLFILLLLALLFLFHDQGQQDDRLVPYIGSFGLSFVAVFVFPFADYALKAYFGDAEFIKNAQDFRAATNKWQHLKTITGLGFWRALRGTALEQAAASLFRDRGWQVSTTALTGDGGIDIVLARGGKTIYCQCKGHAKPVTVGAVRQIAGVCAASSAAPMLIVVNGVTGPALKEAQKLSVLVWDSRELTLFAKGSLTLN